MPKVLCESLLRAYKNLPYLNRLTEEDVENGLLRIKYILPFLLDKNHPVESIFRKIFFNSFVISVFLLSAYFGYVLKVGSGLVFMQVAFLSWLSGWAVASFYRERLHAMHLRFKAEGERSGEFPYVHGSFISTFLSIIALIAVALIFRDVLEMPSGQFVYQYLILIILYNYLINICTMYANIVFIESGVFDPKGVKLVWIVGLLYFLYAFSK